MKHYTLIEFFVLIAIILVLIAMFIPCCRSLREKAQEYDSSVRVLKAVIIKGEKRDYRYTKFSIEGHDYFIIGETGSYRKGELVHCPDCIKCREREVK